MKILVLYRKDIEETKAFFEAMGLSFVKEKHGIGPEHYACQKGDFVLEIYPTNTHTGERYKFL